MLFKTGLAAIALLVGSIVVLQTAGQVVQDPVERPGVRLNEEVTRTNRTAGRLDDSFANIVPPMPPRRDISFTPEDGQAAMSAPQVGGLGGSGESDDSAPGIPSQPDAGEDQGSDPPGGQGPAVTAEPEPTPDRYPSYNSPADLAAAGASEFNDRMREELEIQETEYTRAVEQFYGEWSNRYGLAIDSHKRFRWRVDRVGAIAADYFEHQTELTSLMPNADRRAVFRIRDQEEKELYRQWQLQAKDILSQSNAIMEELRQLNLEITKLRLSANFSALHQEFQTIPYAITQLHDDLELFRSRSELLQQRFSTGEVHSQ